MEVQAVSSATKVKNAYVTYLKKQIANCAYGENIEYLLYDFNKDGTKELVVYDDKDAGALVVSFIIIQPHLLLAYRGFHSHLFSI